MTVFSSSIRWRMTAAASPRDGWLHQIYWSCPSLRVAATKSPHVTIYPQELPVLWWGWSWTPHPCWRYWQAKVTGCVSLLSIFLIVCKHVYTVVGTIKKGEPDQTRSRLRELNTASLPHQSTDACGCRREGWAHDARDLNIQLRWNPFHSTAVSNSKRMQTVVHPFSL